MIIQCSQCKTKFKLDDSRIKGASAKVRCARCKHIFTVTKEEATLPQADIVAAFEQTPEFEAPTSDNAFTQQQEKPAPETPLESPDNQPETPDVASDTFAFATDQIVFGDVDFGFDAAETPKKETPEPSFPADESESFEQTPEFETPISDSPFAQQQEEPEPYSPFDSSDDQPETPDATFDTSTFATSEIVFGDAGFGFNAAETSKEETPESPFSSHETDSFVFDQPTQAAPDETTEDPFGMSAALEEPSETEEEIPGAFGADFSAKEIDFNTEFSSDVTQEQEKPEETTSETDFSFDALSADAQPPAETPTTSVSLDPPSPSFSELPEMGEEVVLSEDIYGEDLPPLSISSRRKSSSSTKLIVLAIVIVVLALGYFGKNFFKGVYNDLYKKIAPTTQQSEGRILLRSINAEFVNNSNTGNELLVINGEAVNEFSTPRGLLQVKGILYGANDHILGAQTAYCGNPLSSEQLKTFPLRAIETAMNQQTGPTLANIEVKPGEAVPFTIVITPVPETAESFGVEVVGSQTIPDNN